MLKIIFEDLTYQQATEKVNYRPAFGAMRDGYPLNCTACSWFDDQGLWDWFPAGRCWVMSFLLGRTVLVRQDHVCDRIS